MAKYIIDINELLELRLCKSKGRFLHLLITDLYSFASYRRPHEMFPSTAFLPVCKTLFTIGAISPSRCIQCLLVVSCDPLWFCSATDLRGSYETLHTLYGSWTITYVNHTANKQIEKIRAIRCPWCLSNFKQSFICMDRALHLFTTSFNKYSTLIAKKFTDTTSIRQWIITAWQMSQQQLKALNFWHFNFISFYCLPLPL